MSLTLALIVGGVIAAGMLYFWNQIVFFFQTRMIPWVRARLGNGSADLLANLVAFADKGATFVRRNVRAGYRWLCNNILGLKSTYSPKNAAEVTKVTEGYIYQGNDQYEHFSSVETVKVDDLPPEARKNMIKNNCPAEVDDLDALKTRIKKRAEEEGIELEAAA
ncbi:MAG: hypothetical protein IKK39_14655 [Thermoguttaceae bacterium]|nr:hypothetical protein [Thermoguttaceae bacterium]MBR4105285.1 hypothetical protein [Thermoguttaceae bacterium]